MQKVRRSLCTVHTHQKVSAKLKKNSMIVFVYKVVTDDLQKQLYHITSPCSVMLPYFILLNYSGTVEWETAAQINCYQKSKQHIFVQSWSHSMQNDL